MWLKYSLISLILFALILFAGRQSSASQVNEDSKQLPVILESLKTPDVCRTDTTLAIQAVLLNASEQDVWINPDRFQSQSVTYSALIDTETMQRRTEGLGVAMDYFYVGHEIEWNTLVSPGGFYKKEIQIPLRDQFFTKDGYYEAVVTTVVLTRDQGAVSSQNKFIFQIRSCS